MKPTAPVEQVREIDECLMNACAHAHTLEVVNGDFLGPPHTHTHTPVDDSGMHPSASCTNTHAHAYR